MQGFRHTSQAGRLAKGGEDRRQPDKSSNSAMRSQIKSQPTRAGTSPMGKGLASPTSPPVTNGDARYHSRVDGKGAEKLLPVIDALSPLPHERGHFAYEKQQRSSLGYPTSPIRAVDAPSHHGVTSSSHTSPHHSHSLPQSTAYSGYSHSNPEAGFGGQHYQGLPVESISRAAFREPIMHSYFNESLDYTMPANLAMTYAASSGAVPVPIGYTIAMSPTAGPYPAETHAAPGSQQQVSYPAVDVHASVHGQRETTGEAVRRLARAEPGVRHDAHSYPQPAAKQYAQPQFAHEPSMHGGYATSVVASAREELRAMPTVEEALPAYSSHYSTHSHAARSQTVPMQHQPQPQQPHRTSNAAYTHNQASMQGSYSTAHLTAPSTMPHPQQSTVDSHDSSIRGHATDGKGQATRVGAATSPASMRMTLGVNDALQLAITSMTAAEERGEPPLPDLSTLHATALHAIVLRESHLARLKSLASRFAAAHTAYLMSENLPRHRREVERNLRNLRLEILLVVDLLRSVASETIESIRNWQRGIVAVHGVSDVPPFEYLEEGDYAERMRFDIARLCDSAGIPLVPWCGIDPHDNPLLLAGVVLGMAEGDAPEEAAVPEPHAQELHQQSVVDAHHSMISTHASARDGDDGAMLEPQPTVIIHQQQQQPPVALQATPSQMLSMPQPGYLPPGYSLLPLLVPTSTGYFALPFIGQMGLQQPIQQQQAQPMQAPVEPVPIPAPTPAPVAMEPVQSPPKPVAVEPKPEPPVVAPQAPAPTPVPASPSPSPLMASVELSEPPQDVTEDDIGGEEKDEEEEGDEEEIDMSAEGSAAFALQRVYRGHRARIRVAAGKRIMQLVPQCRKLCGAITPERIDSLVGLIRRALPELESPLASNALGRYNACIVRPLLLLLRAALSLAEPLQTATQSFQLPPQTLAEAAGKDSGRWLSERMHEITTQILEKHRGMFLSPQVESIVTAALSDITISRSLLFKQSRPESALKPPVPDDDDDTEAVADDDDPDPDNWWRYNSKRVGVFHTRENLQSFITQQFGPGDSRTAMALLAWCNAVVKIAELSPVWFMGSAARDQMLSAEKATVSTWAPLGLAEQPAEATLRRMSSWSRGDESSRSSSGRLTFTAPLIAIGPDVDLGAARTAASRLLASLGMSGIVLPTWRSLSYLPRNEREDDEASVEDDDPTSLKLEFAQQAFAVLACGCVPIVRVSHYMQLATFMRMVSDRRRWDTWAAKSLMPCISATDKVDFTIVWMRMSEDARGEPPPADKEAASLIIRMKKVTNASLKTAPVKTRVLQLAVVPELHAPNPPLGIAVFEVDGEDEAAIAAEEQDPVALARRARERDNRLLSEFDAAARQLLSEKQASARVDTLNKLLSPVWQSSAWVGMADAFLPRMTACTSTDATAYALMAISRVAAASGVVGAGSHSIRVDNGGATPDSSAVIHWYGAVFQPRSFYAYNMPPSARTAPSAFLPAIARPLVLQFMQMRLADITALWQSRLPQHIKPADDKVEWNPRWQDLLPELQCISFDPFALPPQASKAAAAKAPSAATMAKALASFSAAFAGQCLLSVAEHGAWATTVSLTATDATKLALAGLQEAIATLAVK